MVVDDPFKVPSSASMTFSERFRFNLNYDNRSLPKIIPYLTFKYESPYYLSIGIKNLQVSFLWSVYTLELMK